MLQYYYTISAYYVLSVYGAFSCQVMSDAKEESRDSARGCKVIACGLTR